MSVSIVKVMIPQTKTFCLPRWFVEVRFPGDLCIHDDSNHASEEDALSRKAELEARS